MDKLELIKINDWIFDPLKKTLSNDNIEDTPVFIETLESKHASLLLCLIDKQDEIVSRDQLIEIVWNNRFIDDRTINATVSRLRKILGGTKDQYIKTHPKLGYSFTSKVQYIDRPTPEKIKIEKKEKTNLTLYKSYAVLLTTVFFVLLWFLLNNLEKPVVTIKTDDIKIEPLTYSEGWEFQPALSKNKDLLAYVSLADEYSKYHVHIQNTKTKKSIVIDEDVETTSPFWSNKSNELYYVAHIEKKCFIKKLKIDKHLQVNNIENITSCGGENELPNIAVNSDLQWLYYVYDASPTSASIIQRIHLETKQIEILTAPHYKQGGDYGMRLSKDDKYISFIRKFSEDENTVMAQTISNGEIKEITDKTSKIYSIAWTENSNYLTFIDNTNTLYLTDIRDKKTTALYKHSEVIMEHVFISSDELLLSFGDLYKANIKQINLTADAPKVESLISSTFKDHSADIHIKNDSKSIAFVSNRSGNYQIWLQKAGELAQVTHFTQSNTYITDMLFSPDGKNLLFKLNNKLHTLSLKTNKIKAVSHPTEKIKNAVWSCDNNDSIWVVAQSSGIWNAYNVNLSDFSSNKLIAGVTSIQANCSNQQYIVSKQNKMGLHAMNLEGKFIEQNSYFSNIPFVDKHNWAVSDNNVYRRLDNANKLVAFNFINLQKTTFALKNYDPSNLSVNGNALFFNDLLPDNTFIGKITIPKIKDTMILK